MKRFNAASVSKTDWTWRRMTLEYDRKHKTDWPRPWQKTFNLFCHFWFMFNGMFSNGNIQHHLFSCQKEHLKPYSHFSCSVQLVTKNYVSQVFGAFLSLSLLSGTFAQVEEIIMFCHYRYLPRLQQNCRYPATVPVPASLTELSQWCTCCDLVTRRCAWVCSWWAANITSTCICRVNKWNGILNFVL